MDIKESNGLISVIIPVYNRENYIDDCIKSVIKQTYEKWEIILVDDGSTDGTYKKATLWSEYDARIKVFKQENQGPGLARNRGMKEAIGEYIAFLDSDDFWRDESALSKIMCEINGKDYNVIGTFYTHFMEGKFIDIPRHRVFFAPEEETGRWISFEEEQDCFGFCSYLYRREFLEKNKFEFPDYLIEQDPPFLAKVLEHAKKYYVIPVEFATIRHRPRKRFTTQRKTNDCIRGVLDVIDIAQNGNFDKLLDQIIDYADSNSGIFIKNILEGNVELLQLILKLQEKVAGKNIKNKTLQFIYYSMKQEIKKELQEFYKTIESASILIIYGSGNYGKLFLEKMLKLNIQQDIVFAETEEPRNRVVCGKKCYKLEELIKFKEKAMVVVSVKNKNMQSDMTLYLKALGFENYILDDYNLEITLENGIVEKTE